MRFDTPLLACLALQRPTMRTRCTAYPILATPAKPITNKTGGDKLRTDEISNSTDIRACTSHLNQATR